MTPDEMRDALVAAGFADFDSRRAYVLHDIASSLQHRRLDTFADVNECVGTKNGLASGWVDKQCRDLRERGYITISEDWAITLTESGVRAAQCLGIDPFPSA
jgi:hypothetical protein